MGEAKQTQKGGDDSTNIQVIVNGLSYSDTKALCMDLIRGELAQYRSEANRVANERANDFISKLISRFHQERLSNDKILEEFKDPDMQFGFLSAQRSYIKQGQPYLLDVLSQLLVDRAKKAEHDLLQIAISESIDTAPKLLQSQIDILTLVFLLKYTQNHGIVDDVSFRQYCEIYLFPFMSDIPEKASIYQHIDYTNCGSISALGGHDLVEALLKRYRILFSYGISEEQINSTQYFRDVYKNHPTFFTKCVNDPAKFQMVFMNESVLDDELEKLNLCIEETNLIKQAYNSIEVMSNDNAKAKILVIVPELEELLDRWQRTQINRLTLTSVGIVIAATNFKNKTGEELDINIWI